MDIYTIGFTQTTAEHFFDRLKTADVGRLLDVRLNNSSQLAGFAKARDLPFFLRELMGATYDRRRHWLQVNGLCLEDRPCGDLP